MPLLKRSRSKTATSRSTAVTKVSSQVVEPQLTSPLLSLPYELREQIFSYASLTHPNLKKPYNPHTFYYRPEFTHASKIPVNLLLVCRQIYLEAYLLPLLVNEHVVWGCEASRAPKDAPTYLLPGKSKSGKKLRYWQRQAVKRVHIFAQQFWLENFNNHKGGWADFCGTWSPKQKELLPRTPSLGLGDEEASKPNVRRLTWKRQLVGHTSTVSRQSSFASTTSLTANDRRELENLGSQGPEELRMTIRHTDWWNYLLGDASPLAVDPLQVGRATQRVVTAKTPSSNNATSRVPSAPRYNLPEPGSWGFHISQFRKLQVFHLELETLASKASELEEIITFASTWAFPVGDDHVLIFVPDRTERSSWTGSACFSTHAQTEEEDRVRVPTGWINSLSRVASKYRSSGDGPESPVRTGREFLDDINGAFDGQPQPSYQRLEYVVVKLTWVAKKREDCKEQKNQEMKIASDDAKDGIASSVESESGIVGLNAEDMDEGVGNGGGDSANAASPPTIPGSARPVAAMGRDVIPSYWG